MDAVGAQKCLQVEWNHVIQGHELSSSFSRSLLASAVLGDLGPSAMFHVSIYAELLCHPPLHGLFSVGWHWSPRVPFLLGSKAFLKLKAVGPVFCWPIIILESFSWEILMMLCGDPAYFN